MNEVFMQQDYYVLLDSDTLENIVDLIRREGGGI